MTWTELRSHAIVTLAEAGRDMPAQLAQYWLEDLRASLAIGQLNCHSAIDDLAKAKSQLERLALGEPLPYVSEIAHFYGHRLYVETGVLIPRPETEELVRWILERETQPSALIADICTGSGCIGVALGLARPNWRGTLVDLVPIACLTAQRNVGHHKLADRFEVAQDDVLVASMYLTPANSFDILIANPPYIPDSDWVRVDAGVSMWEPHLALRVTDADPLIFYSDIIAEAKHALLPAGRLYFECNDIYTEEVALLLRGRGFESVEVFTDMQGKARHVCGTLA